MVLEEIPIALDFDLLALRRISVAFLSNYFSNRRCQHELDIEWMNRCWLNGGWMSVANYISPFCQTPPPPRIGRLQIVRLLALPPHCDIMGPRPRRNMTPTVHFPAVKVAKLNIMTAVIGNPCRTKGALPDSRYQSHNPGEARCPAMVADIVRGGINIIRWQNIYSKVPPAPAVTEDVNGGHLIRSNG